MFVEFAKLYSFSWDILYGVLGNDLTMCFKNEPQVEIFNPYTVIEITHVIIKECTGKFVPVIFLQYYMCNKSTGETFIYKQLHRWCN